MRVIYEPKGRAREYSPLACNLYIGCTHGCKYCYAPACMRKTAVEWHSNAKPRSSNILELFEKDCQKLSGKHSDDDDRRVLFCFLSDPYQPLEKELHLTRKGIAIASKYGIKVDVLTKGDPAIIEQDLQLMKDCDVHLGITLSFSKDASRLEWEPNASSVQSRLTLLQRAHEMGIYTWVSLEPVIFPLEALEVIRRGHQYVDYWKVGKLNHDKKVESKVDWQKFREDVVTLLDSYCCKYYIKDDLMNA